LHAVYAYAAFVVGRALARSASRRYVRYSSRGTDPVVHCTRVLRIMPGSGVLVRIDVSDEVDL
jgi:hypothetical protein